MRLTLSTVDNVIVDCLGGQTINLGASDFQEKLQWRLGRILAGAKQVGHGLFKPVPLHTCIGSANLKHVVNKHLLV